jgi:hypothetical protein
VRAGRRAKGGALARGEIVAKEAIGGTEIEESGAETAGAATAAGRRVHRRSSWIS